MLPLQVIFTALPPLVISAPYQLIELLLIGLKLENSSSFPTNPKSYIKAVLKSVKMTYKAATFVLLEIGKPLNPICPSLPINSIWQLSIKFTLLPASTFM